MLFLLIFLKLSLFLSNAAALDITVQPYTIAGQPSVVSWTREPTDGVDALAFDLRFVGPGSEDDGLALANIRASPSTQSGTAKVVFHSSGPFRLVAVSGADFNWMGESRQVNVYTFPVLPPVSPTSTSVSPTSTSQSVPCATTTVPSASIACGAFHKTNLGAIVGGTLGGVAFLGLLAALAVMLVRRRQQQPENKRWTFYRDRLIRPADTNVNPVSRSTTERSSTDIEQGLPGDTSQDVSQDLPQDLSYVMRSPRFMIASPNGPRPFIRSFRARPLPPAPLTVRQEMILERMDQVRNQMMALEKNAGPAQHIILDDMQKQMSWLQDQLGAPWAMGLTDVTPHGYGHNMSA